MISQSFVLAVLRQSVDRHSRVHSRSSLSVYHDHQDGKCANEIIRGEQAGESKWTIVGDTGERERELRRESSRVESRAYRCFVAVMAALGPLEREPWLEDEWDVGRGPRVTIPSGAHTGERVQSIVYDYPGSCRLQLSVNLTPTRGSMYTKCPPVPSASYQRHRLVALGGVTVGPWKGVTGAKMESHVLELIPRGILVQNS